MPETKIAFVTGAGSGIGKATCKIFAREGVTVIAADLIGSSAEATVKSLPGTNHVSLALDVTNDEQVQSTFQNFKSRSMLPTMVVNCAGISETVMVSSILDRKKDEYEKVLAVNLGGTISVSHYSCEALIEAKLPGSIVNISSIGATMGTASGGYSYVASKAGVMTFTRSLALEMAKHNIRCNSVLPGITNTPMLLSIPQQFHAQMTAMIPLQRLAEPEEIAELIFFLASDKSSYITGSAVPITGGMY